MVSLLSGQSFSGIYSDGVTVRLDLNKDQTFRLSQSDPIFTNRFEKYRSEGSWTASGDTIRLNPEAVPRQPEIKLRQRADADGAGDSVTLRLQYNVEHYEGDTMLGRAAYPIEQVTIYLDKRRRGYNLVKDHIFRRCAFAPRVKRQVLPDASGVFRLPAEELPQRIGVLTYGFSEIVWLPVSGTNLELEIVQPVDVHRTPRNKVVIMKKGRAYFFEYRGKVRTGGLLSALERIGD